MLKQQSYNLNSRHYQHHKHQQHHNIIWKSLHSVRTYIVVCYEVTFAPYFIPTIRRVIGFRGYHVCWVLGMGWYGLVLPSCVGNRTEGKKVGCSPPLFSLRSYGDWFPLLKIDLPTYYMASLYSLYRLCVTLVWPVPIGQPLRGKLGVPNSLLWG